MKKRILLFVLILSMAFVPMAGAANLTVEKLIPYDDNMNRTSIRPYAANVLLTAIESDVLGTAGSAVDLGFAVGQHFCYAVIGSEPTTAIIDVLGSSNASDYEVIGQISFVAATGLAGTGDVTKSVGISAHPTRYLKGKWSSATGAYGWTKMTVRCVSGGN